MKAFKNLTALSFAIIMGIFSIAQLSPKKPAFFCKKCRQEAAAASVSGVEDLSLVNLLTLKFR